MDRVKITDFEALGQLVKRWARGDSSYPLPDTLSELKKQLAKAGVGATLPDYVRKVKFVAVDSETLLIPLPSPAMVKDSEDRLQKNPGAYPLPPFYRDAFGGAAPSPSDSLKFHAQRIGDYTIWQCM